MRTDSEDDGKRNIGSNRSEQWFEDPLGADLVQYHRIRGKVYSGRSRFQSVEIIDTGSFGRCLVLDNRIQSCVGDEFIYHESLVQPAMCCHPEPLHVLIAGGGEGATSRQVLVHPSVTRLVMVDIDEDVIRICRERLPELHGGSFYDARFELVLGDARKYIEETAEKFDVILLDLPESMEGGPARLLYTEEFYRVVSNRLNTGGIVAVQSDNASWGYIEAFPIIVNTLKRAFSIVRPYQAHIPSFGGSWGFAVASQTLDPLLMSAKSIDQSLARRKIDSLAFYDGLTHVHLFSLPLHLRQRLSHETRTITDAKPLGMKIFVP